MLYCFIRIRSCSTTAGSTVAPPFGLKSCIFTPFIRITFPLTRKFFPSFSIFRKPICVSITSTGCSPSKSVTSMRYRFGSSAFQLSTFPTRSVASPQPFSKLISPAAISSESFQSFHTALSAATSAQIVCFRIPFS